MALSPRMSFKGYKFSEALYRNIDSLKALLTVVGGINFALVFSTGFDWQTLLVSLAATGGALGVKLLIDAIHYFFAEVEYP
jgi:hypothetical protein